MATQAEKEQEMNVLITQVSRMGAVCWIKCIRRITSQKISIYGCDYIPFGFSSGSQLVDYFVISPNPSEDAYDYMKFISTFYNQNNIDILLPVMDDEINILIQHKNFSNINMVAPEKEIFTLFYDKKLATQAILNLGLTVPTVLSNVYERENVIIRDRIGIGSRGITILKSKQKNDFYELTSKQFIQEYITGDEYTVDVLCDSDGNPVIIIPRKRLEIRQGLSFRCQLINDYQIIAACQKIYKHYKIPGISNVQFIKTNENLYFIELNCRIGGTTIASVLASFNFTELFFKNFVKKIPLGNMSNYMEYICWNSIISRYYEEVLFMPEH